MSKDGYLNFLNGSFYLTSMSRGATWDGELVIIHKKGLKWCLTPDIVATAEFLFNKVV